MMAWETTLEVDYWVAVHSAKAFSVEEVSFRLIFHHMALMKTLMPHWAEVRFCLLALAQLTP